MKNKFLILTAVLSLFCACQKSAAEKDDPKQEQNTPSELILGKWALEKMDETAYALSTYFGFPDKKNILDYGVEDIPKEVSIEIEFLKEGQIKESIAEDGRIDEFTGYYRWVKDSDFITTGSVNFLDAGGNVITVEKITKKELVLLILRQYVEIDKIWEERMYLSKVK